MRRPALLLQLDAPFGQRQRLVVTMLHQRDVGLIAANGGEDVAGFNEQRQPPVDVVRACDFTIPGLIAHESAMKGGEWCDVPLMG